jgi:copper chaperone CopZ
MLKKLIIAVIIFTAAGNKAFAKNISFTDSTITVKVRGVTCSGDLKTLADNVKELKGVSECKPGKMGATSVFEVTYNPALVSSKEIYKAFENTAGCQDPNDRPYKVKKN